jgi:hypothetical protein
VQKKSIEYFKNAYEGGKERTDRREEIDMSNWKDV